MADRLNPFTTKEVKVIRDGLKEIARIYRKESNDVLRIVQDNKDETVAELIGLAQLADQLVEEFTP